MRFIIKIIVAPFLLILTVMVAVLTFLFCYAEAALNVLSGIGVLLGVVALISKDMTNTNGLIILFLAFLISPLGLPRIAEWLLDRLSDLRFSLQNFILS